MMGGWEGDDDGWGWGWVGRLRWEVEVRGNQVRSSDQQHKM